jgi:hypothetical protein
VISGIDNEYALNAYLLFHSHACSFDLKLYNADFFSRIDTQNELNKIALELDEYLTSEEGCNIVGNSTQEYAIES